MELYSGNRVDGFKVEVQVLRVYWRPGTRIYHHLQSCRICTAIGVLLFDVCQIIKEQTTPVLKIKFNCGTWVGPAGTNPE